MSDPQSCLAFPADSDPAGTAGEKLAIVTCMDPRLRLPEVLGLDAERSFTLRNGGGRVTDDVIRGLLMCTRILGVTKVAVLHHTDCRLQEYSNAELRLKTGVDIDFMSISDPVSSVFEDIRRLQESGLFTAAVSILGALYQVEDHTVKVVAGAW